MARIIYISGGTRSGKSAFAEKLALEREAPLCYLATAQSLDSEMEERVARHALRRGPEWQTVEEPLLLGQALTRCDGVYGAILLDCLTLWLSNLLLADENPGRETEERILNEVRGLTGILRNMTTPVIIVSSEVGLGIVPEHRLGRLFRDIAGQANQLVAATAHEAWLVASGIPLRLK
jgi:adenosylcobinamide kinase/adenosylcobinamide-phosphate guanylyltransferase